MTAERYNAREAEPRWQKVWEERGIFATRNEDPRPKYYVLEMFPYPSGRIHMGHVRNYTMGDVVARYKRAMNLNVLHPMGWDAFGMPAENAAIERKVHPKTWTYDNIAAMKSQLKSMGLSLDWSREIATCDPDYYKHQQKMFLDFLQAGLVERKQSKVNWDPVDQTVLANEQVIDGRGWRSGALVEQRELTQWFFKITAFSEDLARGARPSRPLARQGALDAAQLDRPFRGPAHPFRARSENDAERRKRAGDFHDAPRHAVRREIHGAVARSSAQPCRGGEKSGARRLYRGMQTYRHRAGAHRQGGKAWLRHRDESAPSIRSVMEASDLCRQFRPDGLRHRRHFRLPGARSARPRFRQQIRARRHARGLPGRPGSGDLCHHRHRL